MEARKLKYRQHIINVKRKKANESSFSVLNANDSFISQEVANETNGSLQVDSHHNNALAVPDILIKELCKAKFQAIKSSDIVVEINPEMKIGSEVKGHYICLTC